MPSPTYSDENFDIKRKVIYYPYETIHGMIGTTATDTSAHTSNAIQKEISTVGLVGLLIEADGDMLNGLTLLPRDLDWTKDIGIRIVWQGASATDTEYATWIVLYDVMVEGTALAVGTTALDTAITAADTKYGTAYALEISARGIIAADTFTEAQVVPGSTFVTWLLECDAETVTGDIHLLGFLLDYVPKRYKGTASTLNPAVTAEDGI